MTSTIANQNAPTKEISPSDRKEIIRAANAIGSGYGLAIAVYMRNDAPAGSRSVGTINVAKMGFTPAFFSMRGNKVGLDFSGTATLEKHIKTNGTYFEIVIESPHVGVCLGTLGLLGTFNHTWIIGDERERTGIAMGALVGLKRDILRTLEPDARTLLRLVRYGSIAEGAN
jgi:hypothetical protein